MTFLDKLKIEHPDDWQFLADASCPYRLGYEGHDSRCTSNCVYCWDREISGTEGQYWKNICRIHDKQTEKGIATYGQTLEQNTKIGAEDRLTMIEEELIDALMYIEHFKKVIQDERDDGK